MLRYYYLRRLNLKPRPSGFDKVEACWKVFSGQLMCRQFKKEDTRNMKNKMNPNTVYRIFVKKKQPYFVMCENLLKGLIYLSYDLHVEHVD
jgi:hypothetical protein